MEPSERTRGPALLCHDGSDGSRAAIRAAGAVLGGGPAVVLCVWESTGSMLLRHSVPGSSLGRDLRGITEDVVTELDAGTAERAQATADEGADVARSAGFDARALAQRALAGPVERAEVTVWQAVLAVADEHDASLVVVGSRGRSAIRSAVLGSVSYGIVHHSTRPVLVVPGG